MKKRCWKAGSGKGLPRIRSLMAAVMAAARLEPAYKCAETAPATLVAFSGARAGTCAPCERARAW